MEGLVNWCGYDDATVAAVVERANGREVVVQYSEPDGVPYLIPLTSTNKVDYRGEYKVSRDPAARCTVECRRYDNPDGFILFGEMTEGQDRYHWWVEVQRDEGE